jgi:hypothetical protein
VSPYLVALAVGTGTFWLLWWAVDRLPYRRRGDTLRLVERGTVRKIGGGSTWRERERP